MYVGLDVHKKYCYATIIDGEGELVSEGRFLNQLEELDNFLQKLEPGSEVVLEASAIWEQLYDRMAEQGFEVMLAHPLKVRAIASAKVKTDRIDAHTLAQLRRAKLIPASYVPRWNPGSIDGAWAAGSTWPAHAPEARARTKSSRIIT